MISYLSTMSDIFYSISLYVCTYKTLLWRQVHCKEYFFVLVDDCIVLSTGPACEVLGTEVLVVCLK